MARSPKRYRVRIAGRDLYLLPVHRQLLARVWTSNRLEAGEFSGVEAGARVRRISTKRVKVIRELIEEAEAFRQVTGEAA